MPTYQGSCHCTAVQFTFEANQITSALRCNCSICKRKGSVLTDFTLAPNALKITAEPGAMVEYQFHTHTAKHHFCTTCGVHTFVQTRLNPGHFRVNLGCVDAVDTFNIPIRVFDGTAI